MQQGLTLQARQFILQYFLNSTPEVVPPPAPTFVGLFIDQGGPQPNELIIGRHGYQRAEVQMIVNENTARNISSVTFPQAETDWTLNEERITHIGLFGSHFDMDENRWISDETDYMIAYMPLTAAETVHAGHTFKFNPQAITMSIT